MAGNTVGPYVDLSLSMDVPMDMDIFEVNVRDALCRNMLIECHFRNGTTSFLIRSSSSRYLVGKCVEKQVPLGLGASFILYAPPWQRKRCPVQKHVVIHMAT